VDEDVKASSCDLLKFAYLRIVYVTSINMYIHYQCTVASKVITSVNECESEQYGGVVIFLNFAYLLIVYVTSMNIVYLYQRTVASRVKMNVNVKREYGERESATVGPVPTV
jgi:hypothetical protein